MLEEVQAKPSECSELLRVLPPLSYPSAPSCSECSPPKLSELSECSPPYLSAFLVNNSTCSPLANVVAKR